MAADRKPILSNDDDTSEFADRRSKRLEVESTTSLRHNLYSVEVKIRNVSTCGFMADCNDRVQIGSYVSLDVPGMGPVHAQVRWQIGGKMGGLFLHPISLNRCEWTATKVESSQEVA